MWKVSADCTYIEDRCGRGDSSPRSEADFDFVSSGPTPQRETPDGFSPCMTPLPSSDDKNQNTDDRMDIGTKISNEGRPRTRSTEMLP